MFDSVFWIQLVTSFLGTAGFAILFRIRLRHLPAAILGGGLTYAIYFVVAQLSASVFAAAFVASACSALYSEILARVKRAPCGSLPASVRHSHRSGRKPVPRYGTADLAEFRGGMAVFAGDLEGGNRNRGGHGGGVLDGSIVCGGADTAKETARRGMKGKP